MVSLTKKPVKIVKNGQMFTRHPDLGWLRLGSSGWSPVCRPF
jgi:hypothetical protein